jgi:very-short-patch-repair endonuclease
MFKKGQKFSEEHRRKISVALTGHKITEETRHKLKISQQTRIRKPFSKEAKMNISKSLKGNKNAIGHRHTEKTKDRIRTSMTSYISNSTGKFRDTKIEQIVENQLKKLSIQYTKQQRLINNKFCVDFFLPQTLQVIECDGCYYHACKQCGHHRFAERRKRDSIRTIELEKHNYIVIRLWEHDICSELFDLSKYL